MEKYLVERNILYAKKGDLTKKELSIRIGYPYIDASGFARCPVEWDGLYEDYADISGMDLFHALQLAMDVDPMLKRLSVKYDFFWTTGEPYFDDD